MNVWRDIYVANANQANVCISSNNAERLYKCIPIDFLPLKCYCISAEIERQLQRIQTHAIVSFATPNSTFNQNSSLITFILALSQSTQLIPSHAHLHIRPNCFAIHNDSRQTFMLWLCFTPIPFVASVAARLGNMVATSTIPRQRRRTTFKYCLWVARVLRC